MSVDKNDASGAGVEVSALDDVSAATPGEATPEDVLFAAPATDTAPAPSKPAFEDDDAWAPLPDRLVDDFDLGALVAGGNAPPAAAPVPRPPPSREGDQGRPLAPMALRPAAPTWARQPSLPVDGSLSSGPGNASRPPRAGAARSVYAMAPNAKAPHPMSTGKLPPHVAPKAAPVADAPEAEIVDLERARTRPPFRLGLPLWIGALAAGSASYVLVFPGSLLLASVAAAMGLTAGLFLQTLMRK